MKKPIIPINLESHEYKSAFEMTYNNATEHKNAAVLLFRNKFTAPAFSHLIFSSEELSKSIILFFAINGYKPQKFDKFFSSHIHIRALFMKLDDLGKFESELSEEPNINSKIIILVAIIVLVVQFSEPQKEENPDFSLKFIIEILRQKSIYVNYDSDSNTFNSPQQKIDETFFEQGFKTLEDTFYKAEQLFTRPHSELKKIYDDLLNLESILENRN